MGSNSRAAGGQTPLESPGTGRDWGPGAASEGSGTLQGHAGWGRGQRAPERGGVGKGGDTAPASWQLRFAASSLVLECFSTFVHFFKHPFSSQQE